MTAEHTEHQQSGAGDSIPPGPGLQWDGPGAEKIAELLRSKPECYSVSVAGESGALLVSCQVRRISCTVLMVFFVGAATVVALLLMIVSRCASGHVSVLSFFGQVFALAVSAALVVGLIRMLRESSLVIMLESDAVTVERRGLFPKVLWWLPRSGVRKVTLVALWPWGAVHSRPRWLVLKAERTYTVPHVPESGLLWLGHVLSAWAGKELVVEGQTASSSPT